MNQIALQFQRQQSLRGGVLATLAGAFRSARRMAASWAERDRQRRELRELDDATLRDIGLSREQVDFEAGKPFWEA